MFERFTPEAREIIAGAEAKARKLGHIWIGTEHLLLALLGNPDLPGVALLREQGVTKKTFKAALERELGTGGFGAKDEEALKAVGIDLDEVRRQAEASFGEGALDAAPTRSGRRRSHRRGACEPREGRLPYSRRARRALDRSLHQAIRLRDRQIGPEHLMLGLLESRTNMAVRVLRDLGADPAAVKAHVRAARNSAA